MIYFLKLKLIWVRNMTIYKLSLGNLNFNIYTYQKVWFRLLPLSIISQQIKTSFRRLRGVLKRSQCLTTKSNVITTSGRRRRICDILKTSDLPHLENVWFTASWGSLIYVILKTSELQRLRYVWFTASWRRPIYGALKMSYLRRPEDICKAKSV